MLQSNSTKRGSGIEIWGDYSDLHSLYSTIHKLRNKLDDSKPKDKGQSEIMMNFAFELRKSFENNRLKQKFSFDSQLETEYYGFKYLWTDLLYLISILRFNAGYITLNELDQGNLFILEYNIKKALYEYDPIGAQVIEYFIGERININDELVALTLNAINIEFLTRKSGKKRFRDIPNLLIAYSPNSKNYKMWKSELEKDAERLNCEPHEIEYQKFPDVIW